MIVDIVHNSPACTILKPLYNSYPYAGDLQTILSDTYPRQEFYLECWDGYENAVILVHPIQLENS